MEIIDRRTFLKRAALVGGAAALASRALPASADTDPAVVGSWEAPVEVGVVGVHAALLHTGRVMLFSFVKDGAGSEAQLFDPSDNSHTDVDVTISGRELFCGGLSFLSDGHLFVTGGHVEASNNIGTTYTTIFDPTSSTWSDGPVMAYARWYPTNLQMADGRTLIMGGQATPGNIIRPPEYYNPSTNTTSTLPSTASTYFGLYPRTVLLPTGGVLKVGKTSNTKLFDPTSNRWRNVATEQFGHRLDGSFVLLSGAVPQKILVAGGQKKTPTGKVVTNTAEIIDMASAQPQWSYTGSMAFGRINLNLVLLPDGKVLAVGGGAGESAYSNPLKQAELYDPTTGLWTMMAAQIANRTYHSTALLLPDGRVLSAGSTNGTPEQTTVELYSPPYLFRTPRPVIDTVSSDTLTYGQSFTIDSAQATEISSVALIRPGAVTHSNNMEQRLVALSFSSSGSQLTADSPSNGNIAPPGYYMLFIVDSIGIPSVASFVHLG